MKFSYQWLCDLVPALATDPKDLQRLITMKTAECEGIEPFGAHFAQVVAARVLSVEPDGKGKNKVLRIAAGAGKTATVVCGAPNVREGMIAAWVPPGTQLQEKMIGRAVIDGIESEGMLASAAELGINRDHSGILQLVDLEPGQPLPSLKPDWIIEIDNKSLTHRPDLWGHIGMAREVAAITGAALHDPVRTELLPHGDPAIQVDISDTALCPRYSALVFENVRVSPSPLWLQARLESLGMNSINNIVDVTNLVMAELPEPMHAFDADKLNGGTIFVRTAQPGESLKALNDETYELSTADLVIADESGPVGLAGVIGGADSAISESTTRIVLESANFQATAIRLTSARYKLRTDASIRFEKSLDPENTIRGLARAVELFKAVCPGIVVRGGVTDSRGPLRSVQPIALPLSFVSRKLGKEVSRERVIRILDTLGFQSRETSPGLVTVTVPSWRATKDISLKDDLVEEIGRMIGYDEIRPAAPLVAAAAPYSNPMRMYLRAVRSQLADQGFTEVHNYSFVSETEIRKFGLEIRDHVRIRNPIASDLTHLRRSLLPGIYRNIVSNVRHYPEHFRIFEIGNEIHPGSGPDLPKEVLHAVAALYADHGDEQDFFELKRALECVFPDARLSAAVARGYEHPVRASEIGWYGSLIGRLFELHPSLLADEGIQGRAVLFDVDLAIAQQLSATRETKYTPPRKYPTSGFDLSVVASLEKPVAEIQDDLENLARPEIAAIDFIRQYDGPPLEEGQKSVSYHLEVGAFDRTLTTDEATDIRNRIIAGMRALGYDFRG